MVVNTCQYMSILTKSHHVNFVTQLPHVGEITGGDGARCPTPNPGSNQAPHGETRLRDLEQIRLRNLQHPATLQHGQRQQQLLYWSTPRWEIHLA